MPLPDGIQRELLQAAMRTGQDTNAIRRRLERYLGYDPVTFEIITSVYYQRMDSSANALQTFEDTEECEYTA